MTPRALVLAAGSLLDQAAEVLIDAAAAAGFGGVGLRLSGEHATGDPSRLAARAAAAGVAIHDAEVYRIGASGDPRPLFEAAAGVGARHVLVVSDVADRAATLTALDELVELGGSLGLTVGLEYMAWTDPAAPGEAAAIAARTGCVVVADLLHHVRVGAGPDELAALVASGTLGWVQLCDAGAPAPAGRDALIHEARHQRRAPGTGALPLPDLLACVPADVPISVEVQSDALAGLSAEARARLLFDTSQAVLAQSPSSTG